MDGWMDGRTLMQVSVFYMWSPLLCLLLNFSCVCSLVQEGTSSSNRREHRSDRIITLSRCCPLSARSDQRSAPAPQVSCHSKFCKVQTACGVVSQTGKSGRKLTYARSMSQYEVNVVSMAHHSESRYVQCNCNDCMQCIKCIRLLVSWF